MSPHNDQVAVSSPMPEFTPTLHYRIEDGILAGAWRPKDSSHFGKKPQTAEAQQLRSAGYIVLPPDPLANKRMQARFGTLRKLLGMHRAQ
jgi:hypothetical protein